MVDLSKAKAGDTVKFRCGGEAVIERINLEGFEYNLRFVDSPWANFYKKDGSKYMLEQPNTFDITAITAIIPAQVDWSTVKAGMAFKDSVGPYIWHFIGYPVAIKGWGVFQKQPKQSCGYTIEAILLTNLTRAPEHDVEAG